MKGDCDMHGGWKGVALLLVSLALWLIAEGMPPASGVWLEIFAAVVGLIGGAYVMNYARDRID